MKELIGALMMLAGIVFGLWVGVWWALVGGIVDVVEAIKATPVDSMLLAVGFVKAFLAGPIGWISGLFLFLPGLTLTK